MMTVSDSCEDRANSQETSPPLQASPLSCGSYERSSHPRKMCTYPWASLDKLSGSPQATHLSALRLMSWKTSLGCPWRWAQDMQQGYNFFDRTDQFWSAWTWSERHQLSVLCCQRRDLCHPIPFLLVYSYCQRKYGLAWYPCGKCTWSFPADEWERDSAVWGLCHLQ